MGNDACEMMNDEYSAGAAIAGAGPSIHPSSFILHPFPVERFTFPAVPEPPEGAPIVESPKVVWPECHDTKMASAYAETADRILRRLSDGADNNPFCASDRPTVMAISSPGDGDGKTSLLVGLAPHLAKRMAGGILVVDANFRKPDLTTRLNVSADKTAARPPSIYPTNLPQLNFLPAPALRMTDVDLPILASWIDDLREGWPLVLLDAPSLAYAEAARLAGCCDGVYLAVRLGHTSRRAVAEAARVIRAVGGRLLGCVVIN
jgi:Mrp family chromosome partitioning ATPase